MKELYLWITTDLDGSFELDRRWYNPELALENSILIVDYKFTPWPRIGGNLLW